VHALENLIAIGITGFVVVAGLSLWLTHAPEVPAFARRSPSSGSPQLRQDLNARFFADRGFLFRKRHWFVATCCRPVRLSPGRLNELSAVQHEHPVNVARNGARRWWWFEDAFYWETAGYGDGDVLALIRDRQRKNKQRLARAHTLLGAEQSSRRRRETIPRDVRRAVFERDGGRCTQCGENFDLQYDHVIPVALGGASTVENLQLLCSPCNQEKGADI
jgi:5-methylcytosine-specific restriction endonuclease McrA